LPNPERSDRRHAPVRLPVILALIVAAGILPIHPARSDTFRIDEESSFEEIRIKPGEAFTIVLRGVGWYINRFDRENLRFTMRKLGEDDASFLMEARHESVAYILFSTAKRDVYVRVRIAPEAEEEVVQTEGNASEAESGGGDKTAEAAQKGVDGGETATGGDGKDVATGDGGETATTADEGGESAGDTGGAAGEEAGSADGGESSVPEGEIYYVDKDKKVVLVPRQSENAAYHRGKEHFKAKRYEKALKELYDYVAGCESCTHIVDAHLMLSAIHEHENRFKDAIDHLEQAVALTPDTSVSLLSEMYERLGTLYREEGLYDEAAAYLRRAYDINGDAVDVLKEIGDLYFLHGSYPDALAAYLECVERNLITDELLFRVARIYDSPGGTRDIEQAYRYYGELVKTFPDSPFDEEAQSRIEFLEENFFNYR
jgi:TolA-binding protein